METETNRRKKQKASQCSVLVRGIPRSVRDLFKTVCQRRGVSMVEAFRQYMTEEVDKEVMRLKRLYGGGE